MSDRWNRCDVCGQFIAYDNFVTGRAVRRLLEPDSDLGTEKWETLCRYHALPFFLPQSVDLSDELERLQKVQPVERAIISLTLIYEEFSRRGDAPQCLKDYIYHEIGRIL